MQHNERHQEDAGYPDGEHSPDFVGCDAVFDSPVVAWDDDRKAYGELRINLLGFLNGVVVHLTYTERGDDLHVVEADSVGLSP